MHLLKILDFNLFDLIYFFAIYSFLGWCTEVIYYIKKEHKFVNRGFLYGPFCPIYGSGIVSIIVLLDNFKNNIFLLFILAFFLTSFIEYFTGLILEKFFKSKWWDYSEDPFNIHGRICLLFSLIWGLASVGVIKVIHPIVEKIVMNIPKSFGNILFYGIIIYFIIDSSFTIASLIKLKNILLTIQMEIDNAIAKHSELLSTQKEKAIENAKAKAVETAQIIENAKIKALENAKSFENPILKLKLTLNHTRLIKAFPNVSSNSFGSILKSLKEKLKKD